MSPFSKDQRIAVDAHSDLSAEIDNALAYDVTGDFDGALVCLRAAQHQLAEWIVELEARTK